MRLKKNKAPASARATALTILSAVVLEQRSLTEVLRQVLSEARSEHAFVKQLCFGTLRFYERLSWQLKQLLSKPLKPDQQHISLVLLLGLYQLQYSHIPTHAAVSETVELLREIHQDWAVALVNAVLRHFLRRQDELTQAMHDDVVAHYCHPQWLITALQSAWPQSWQERLAAGLLQAPLTLRVNTRVGTREAYLQQLLDAGIEAEVTQHSPVGIRLQKGVMVEHLPGFAAGQVSVQDEAAQLAAYLLDLASGQRVLDACAAPGGKSGHILEMADVALTALDVEVVRCRRIHQNLQRLGLEAQVLCADVLLLDRWWDQKAFDRILLDAPCSATGIIRRQPDIKRHRLPSDIKPLAQLQLALLKVLWSTLKPGGILVYATCSMLPQENQQVIQDFLALQGDASLQVGDYPELNDPHATVGLAIPAGVDGMDGFFYAKLCKSFVAVKA